MTPEGRVKAAVKAYLKMVGAYWFMPVQGGYGAASLDFLVCWQGRFIAIETKRPGMRMTPRQVMTSEQMRAAGAVVLVVDDTSRVSDILDPHFGGHRDGW